MSGLQPIRFDKPLAPMPYGNLGNTSETENASLNKTTSDKKNRLESLGFSKGKSGLDFDINKAPQLLNFLKKHDETPEHLTLNEARKLVGEHLTPDAAKLATRMLENNQAILYQNGGVETRIGSEEFGESVIEKNTFSSFLERLDTFETPANKAAKTSFWKRLFRFPDRDGDKKVSAGELATKFGLLGMDANGKSLESETIRKQGSIFESAVTAERNRTFGDLGSPQQLAQSSSLFPTLTTSLLSGIDPVHIAVGPQETRLQTIMPTRTEGIEAFSYSLGIEAGEINMENILNVAKDPNHDNRFNLKRLQKELSRAKDKDFNTAKQGREALGIERRGPGRMAIAQGANTLLWASQMAGKNPEKLSTSDIHHGLHYIYKANDKKHQDGNNTFVRLVMKELGIQQLGDRKSKSFAWPNHQKAITAMRLLKESDLPDAKKKAIALKFFGEDQATPNPHDSYPNNIAQAIQQ